MLAKAFSATPRGVDALFVTVEVDRTRTLMPSVIVVGMADTAVREAKERVFAAVRHLGRRAEPANVVFNLAPADERKQGAGLDLPMAIAFLAAAGELPAEPLRGRLLLGELSLEGRLLPVRGVLPIVRAARAAAVAEVVVPLANEREASVVDGVNVVAAASLAEVVRYLRDGSAPEAQVPQKDDGGERSVVRAPDLADVIGQEQARRALEVAAAGGHHLLFMGPPGSGKSMLARRLPGILPPMAADEAIEATCVYSVSTRVPRPAGLLAERAFRAPHHTISAAALIGGGTMPQPGEVSLAHHGVLFLDELTEFRRDVLEGLRQPLEDRTVTVARARSCLSFPASFQLVAAANPCPCGYMGSEQRSAAARLWLCSATGRAFRVRCSIASTCRSTYRQCRGATSRRSAAASRPRRWLHGCWRQGRCSCGACSAAACTAMPKWNRSTSTVGRNRSGTAAPCSSTPAGPSDSPPAPITAFSGSPRTIADLEGNEALKTHHLAEAVAYRSLDRNTQHQPKAIGEWGR